MVAHRASGRAGSEQAPVVAGGTHMRATVLGDDAATRRSLQKAELEKVWLVHVLDRV